MNESNDPLLHQISAALRESQQEIEDGGFTRGVLAEIRKERRRAAISRKLPPLFGALGALIALFFSPWPEAWRQLEIFASATTSTTEQLVRLLAALPPSDWMIAGGVVAILLLFIREQGYLWQ